MPNGLSAPALDEPPLRSSSEDDAGPADEPETSGVQQQQARQDDERAAANWQKLRVKRKRKESLDELVSSIDFLVYAELAALYYLDTSTLLFLFRLGTHVAPLHTTIALLAPLPDTRSHTSPAILFLSNLIGILVHLLAALPQAGEATGFDLYGHLFIDLIGQRCITGWTGRLRLVCMDLVVFGLQILALGCAAELNRKGFAGKPSASAAVSNDQYLRRLITAEVQRAALNGELGMEMQPLDPTRQRPITPTVPPVPMPPAASTTELDNSARMDEQDMLMAEGAHSGLAPNEEESALRELDDLYAGQVVLVQVRLWDLVRDYYLERRNRFLAGRV